MFHGKSFIRFKPVRHITPMATQQNTFSVHQTVVATAPPPPPPPPAVQDFAPDTAAGGKTLASIADIAKGAKRTSLQSPGGHSDAQRWGNQGHTIHECVHWCVHAHVGERVGLWS